MNKEQTIRKIMSLERRMVTPKSDLKRLTLGALKEYLKDTQDDFEIEMAFRDHQGV